MRVRAINDKREAEEIIRKCQWCHIAMAGPDGKPYVLPMNFGYRDDVIYFHGKQHGKKTDILKHHPDVCINFSTDHLLRYQDEGVACSWSMKYRSILCYGKAEFITDPEEKTAALNIFMSQYSQGNFKFAPPSIREVNVWKVKVEKYEGRAYGY